MIRQLVVAVKRRSKKPTFPKRPPVRRPRSPVDQLEKLGKLPWWPSRLHRLAPSSIFFSPPLPSTSIHLNKKSEFYLSNIQQSLFPGRGKEYCWIMQPDRDLPELVSTGITEQVWSHLSSIYHGDIIIHTGRYDKTVVHYSTTWANSKAGSGVTHLNQSTGHLLMLKSWSDCHF